ncbi:MULTISPECIES: substrate-binding domain-containing protein [Anaerotruncus]|uniref:substrate-binding domain-containing protein n=1 Tax=Anaerotruncus TaxID=244127 RepID=UPI000C773166|nr:substrate-binding domain-containing protein [Anaerotruncus massiliensis (ex Togo et al. 2019)]
MRRGFRRLTAALLCAALLLLPAGCRSGPEEGKIRYVIGVSQANMREPWRLVLIRELQEEAARHPEIRLVITDATSDGEKQVEDIQRLLGYGIDLLIVSPHDVERITPVVSEVYQKIPVIVLDRVVEGYDYSLFIGPDNDLIGKQAGEAAVRLVRGSAAKVLELKGGPHSQASAERSGGFRSVTSLFPLIEIESVTVENESRDAAEDLVSAYGERLREFDVIFAHNDYMALGAYKAAHRLGCDDVKIVGIDGFTGQDGGLELIRGGKIDETITCPTGGREAIQFSLDILGKVSGVPKQVILRSHAITRENVDSYERQLDRATRPVDRTIRVGYAQVGTESGWRLANNQSIRDAAREFGVDLTAIDADNDQQAQLEAVREFIRQRMDVIVISPIVDSGWDEVLMEARDAGIPVLLSDRKISVAEDDLFMTFIGADFIEEGRRAMRWTAANVPADKHPVRILEIQGTVGATPTIERKRGFEMLLAEHPDYSIVYSAGGDFTREGGRLVVERYLREHAWDIDVIYSHNDDMALGAVDALEAAGIQPGRDVKIISVDGTEEAVKALEEGRLNCVVECSPLLGPQLMKAVTDLMSGKELPLRIITDERVFTAQTPREELRGRKY